ncbi:ethylmalonyl-CoA decarboxylase-like [Portunus trituberculatus]|uniref:ethylmalonyl-CoA decarboxylase-like n=1 Tax=Portunus trituberculatus TaxID=210409 RepID=UPI001E1CC53E|nr:ethylmalonyl-CoA decarboxylase-like [Portunus trituberculatus]
MLCVGVAARRGWAWMGVGGRLCSTSMIEEGREKLKELGEGEVTLEKDGESGVATITLRNAKRRNALSGRMMVQLADITHTLSACQDTKIVTLQADGEYFCSGGDLTTVRAICNPRDGLLMSTLMHDTLTRLHTLTAPSVCLVHGPAIGGGAELTTATDFRIFTETGNISFVQGSMGVVTGWGGGTRLTRLVHYPTALDLLLTGRKIEAEEAIKIGLADFIVDSETRFAAVGEWVKVRSGHVGEVVRGFKTITMGARDLPAGESLAEERGVFSPLWGGPANLKALGKNIKHR